MLRKRAGLPRSEMSSTGLAPRAPRAGRSRGGAQGAGGEPVTLGAVEERENRAEAPPAVVGVGAVELGARHARLLHVGEPPARSVPQVAELAELDRVRGARLGAG